MDTKNEDSVGKSRGGKKVDVAVVRLERLAFLGYIGRDIGILKFLFAYQICWWTTPGGFWPVIDL